MKRARMRELLWEAFQMGKGDVPDMEGHKWCDDMAHNGSFCASERPVRKTLCQLPQGHEGSHQAVIYWEDE